MKSMHNYFIDNDPHSFQAFLELNNDEFSNDQINTLFNELLVAEQGIEYSKGITGADLGNIIFKKHDFYYIHALLIALSLLMTDTSATIAVTLGALTHVVLFVLLKTLKLKKVTLENKLRFSMRKKMLLETLAKVKEVKKYDADYFQHKETFYRRSIL